MIEKLGAFIFVVGLAWVFISCLFSGVEHLNILEAVLSHPWVNLIIPLFICCAGGFLMVFANEQKK